MNSTYIGEPILHMKWLPSQLSMPKNQPLTEAFFVQISEPGLTFVHFSYGGFRLQGFSVDAVDGMVMNRI